MSGKLKPQRIKKGVIQQTQKNLRNLKVKKDLNYRLDNDDPKDMKIILP